MSQRRQNLEEAKALLRLAAPVVAVQLGLMGMGLVDTLMVGHHSRVALAAVATGNIYQWGLVIFGQGILCSLDPLVSQAHGANDHAAISLHFQRGLLLAAVLSVPVLLAFQFAAPILRALGQPEEIIPVAASFVRATSLGVPSFFALIVMRQSLYGRNVVRPLLIAVAVGNLVNLAGNWILVYGHLGAPALGAVGSGYSTSISRFFIAAVLAPLAVPELVAGGRVRWRDLVAPSAHLRMLELGVPIGFQMGLEVWVFLTVSLMMGHMGSVALSGHQIAINLASASFMVPIGIGAAGAVRVGNAIGRGDPVGSRRAAFVALGVGASVMTVSALCFGLMPRLLARAFTDDSAVIDATAALLPIAALFQIFDGTQAVGCGILRGAADTRAAMIINFVGYWLLGLPIGMLLAFRFALGPRGLWWGLTAGLAVCATLLVLRVRRRFAASTP